MTLLSQLVRLALTAALLALVCTKMADACMCVEEHPQQHACKADFVILAKVTRFFKTSAAYKISLIREFKMSQKASEALKSGRLVSSKSSCGVDLKKGETYLITGRIISGRASVNLCSYIKPWAELTYRQRKGFRLLYKQSCQCKIQDCRWYQPCTQSTVDASTCPWTTTYPHPKDCQSEHSVCMRHADGSCHWIRDRQYKDCMKTNRLHEKGAKLQTKRKPRY